MSQQTAHVSIVMIVSQSTKGIQYYPRRNTSKKLIWKKRDFFGQRRQRCGKEEAKEFKIRLNKIMLLFKLRSSSRHMLCFSKIQTPFFLFHFLAYPPYHIFPPPLICVCCWFLIIRRAHEVLSPFTQMQDHLCNLCWNTDRPSGATPLSKPDSFSPSSHQVPIAHQLLLELKSSFT